MQLKENSQFEIANVNSNPIKKFVFDSNLNSNSNLNLDFNLWYANYLEYKERFVKKKQ